MPFDVQLVAALLVFSLIALASRQIGDFFARIHLSLVTGFLLTGMVAGSYVLEVVSALSPLIPAGPKGRQRVGGTSGGESGSRS